MKSFFKLASASLLAIAAAACNDNLAVENLSNPDIEKVFGDASSIEATINSGYQTVHNAITNTNLQPQVDVFALESYSSLNNFSMGPRVAIPRSPILNSNGSSAINSEFSSLSRSSRLQINAVDALYRLIKATPAGLGTPAQNLRARALGFFNAGAALGWLAIIYDSAAIISLGMPSDSIPPLSGAQDVMKAAIAYIDSAVNIAGDPAANGTGGFPTPSSWVNGVPMSAAEFIRFARSYRARFRAGVARTPAERNAVDWDKVIADAEAGITTNIQPVTGSATSSGWNVGFITQMHVDPGWSQMSLMYFGMADTSGAYARFIATPLGNRDGLFLVQTPDNRWPKGATRAEQQTASKPEPLNITSRPYIRNRTLAEVPGDGWGISYYDFFRFKYIRNASNSGLYPEFTKAEVDLLAAEGYIRKGNIAAAAAKIDLTRVAAGLPKLTGVVTTATQAVPGGAGCVPQVPTPQGTVKCGDIMEAMKYEKRMETAYTSFGAWWQDSRGWGDLVELTPWEYPLPYQEIQARYGVNQPTYNLGGGGGSSAAKGTYGF
jgi:hypothetical protein